MESNLKIIADDLGIAESVNDGIIFLLKEGKIDGASLMANGQAFNDAVEKLKVSDGLNIGAHLVLVEEKSLSGIKLPANHREFFIKFIFGLIGLSDIETELKMQLEKIVGFGIKPKFINSHQHLHLLPGISNVMLKLAKEYGISYVRVVKEPVGLSDAKFLRKIQSLFLFFLSNLAIKNIKKAGLRHNDFFAGFLNAGNITEKDLKLAIELSRNYPNKIIELGCHPGHESEELKLKYKNWGKYNWENELNLFKISR